MKDANEIRILTVDDHHLFREGIAAVIRTQPDMLLIAQASNTKEAIERHREFRPDVTLMDLRVPDMGGINAMIAIRAEFPDARVIILTTFSGNVEVQRALEAGACAYALKSMPPAELLETIRLVHSGKRRIPPEVAANLAEHYSDEALSDREVEVLRQIGDGNRNRDIADKLFICEETVKVHVKRIMQKLNASDRTQAFAIGVRRGIIEL
jgi:DNA-binding NarL/FixJ family response regulator